MVRKIVIVFFIICSVSSSWGQNPGGVGTVNITAWFKADALANGNVTSWVTTFPTGASSITVSDAISPYPLATNTPTGDVSNYNTTIAFLSNSWASLKALQTSNSLDLLDLSSSTDQGTFISAYYLPSSSFNGHFMLYNESGTDAIQFRNLGVNGRFAIGKGLGGSTNASRGWADSYEPQLISFTGNRSNSTSMKFYNQSYLTTTSNASQSSGPTGLYFGMKPYTTNSALNGYLHEVIFYNRDLTNLELSKVHTYLAVKYGVTLLNTGGGTQGDYVATNGVITWDASLTNAYHNDVIGLARDDAQGLLQKQSHAFDDKYRFYISTLQSSNNSNTGVFINNLSYLMAGSNNASLCTTTSSNSEVPAGFGITDRLAREWKVTKTNFTDSFNIDITLSPCAQLSNSSCLKLLVDDDGDFTNATVYSTGNGLSFSVNGSVVTVSGISDFHLANNSTKYITIGAITPQVDLGNDTTLCNGNSILLDASIPGATYLWQNNSVDSLFNVIVPDTYWVEVNLLGCIVTDTIKVLTGVGPIINLGADTVICEFDSLILNPGYSSSTFTWQNNSTDTIYNVFQAGTYWVEMNTNNCLSSDTIVVGLQPLPVINLGSDTAVCDGDAFLLDATNPNATYSWQDNSMNAVFNVTQTGNYWVEVAFNLCINSDTVNVVYNPIPIIDLGNDTVICEPDTLVLDASFPGATYIWQDNSALPQFNASNQGLFYVSVNRFNCNFRDTISITVEPKPDADLGSDTVLCTGTTFLLNSTSQGASFLWQDGSTKYYNQVSTPGQYWIEVTKGNCFNTDTIFVTGMDKPIVNIGNDTSICPDDSVVLSTFTPLSTYIWSTGDVDSSITVNEKGQYWVEVTNACGSIRDKINLFVTSLPVVELGEDMESCIGDEVVLDASWPNSTYLWNDGSDQEIYTVHEEGEYLVSVTNKCGTAKDTVIFEFKDCQCALFIPNAFTPNGDNIDDDFGPVSYCELKAYNFVIYDRWGMVVFMTEDPNAKWDGTLYGKWLENGLYNYVLKYNFEKSGDKVEYEVTYGNVTLLR
jgi:gliding motility-associated-like protein